MNNRTSTSLRLVQYFAVPALTLTAVSAAVAADLDARSKASSNKGDWVCVAADAGWKCNWQGGGPKPDLPSVTPSETQNPVAPSISAKEQPASDAPVVATPKPAPVQNPVYKSPEPVSEIQVTKARPKAPSLQAVEADTSAFVDEQAAASNRSGFTAQGTQVQNPSALAFEQAKAPQADLTAGDTTSQASNSDYQRTEQPQTPLPQTTGEDVSITPTPENIRTDNESVAANRRKLTTAETYALEYVNEVDLQTTQTRPKATGPWAPADTSPLTEEESKTAAWGDTTVNDKPWPQTEAPMDLGPIGADIAADNFGLRTLHEPIKWGQCSTAFMPPLEFSVAAEKVEGDGQHLEANSFQTFNDLPGEPIVLTGNAISLDNAQAFRAERIIQRSKPNRIDGIGNTRVFNGQMAMVADRGFLYSDTHQGSFENAEYFLRDGHGRGSAEHMEMLGPQLRDLQEATFTTCASDSPFWNLDADHVRMDMEEGIAYADNAVLNILGLPVFYTPYASFPIDERRRTGFLVPTLMNSNANGVGLMIPFYLNLAENMDATMRARVMANRGTMGQVDFRYLGRGGISGMIEATYLPDDPVYAIDEPDQPSDRHRIAWQHSQPLTPNLRLNVDYEDLSDDRYNSNFGLSLETTSINHVERSVKLTYSRANWQLYTKVNNWQTVNKSLRSKARPYDTYPEMVFHADWMVNPLDPIDIDLDAEFHHFVRNERPAGSRVFIKPTISKTYGESWWYLNPKAEFYATAYDLYDTGNNFDPRRSITVPVLSLTGGLHLERTYKGGEEDYVHSVEPFFQYTIAPYEDQSRIPTFDTGVRSVTFDELLNTNQFTGPDRVNDANRLSLGARSALTNDKGYKYANLGIVEQIYFEDRDVVINGTTSKTADASELASFLSLYPAKDVSLHTTYVWDWNENANLEEKYEFRYHPDRDHIFGLGYRYHRRSLAQFEGFTRWPLWPGFHVVAQAEYNSRNDELVDSLIGFEYENCCWQTRLILHDFKNGGEDQSEFSIGLQFELKGFGFAGSDVEQDLVERIPYYLDEEN